MLRVRAVLGRVLWYLVVSAIAVLMMTPFLWMVTTAFSPPREAMAYPPRFIPSTLYLDNFRDALTEAPLLRSMANSAFVAVCVILANLAVSSLAAYSFARLRFPGRDKVFLLYLSAMMIPFQVTLVPMYLQVAALGWVDTYKAIIIPGSVSVWNIFLLRQFFVTIPQDYEDAARIDGTSRLGFYWRILLPMSRPALATVTLFTFMGSWNSFLWPLIVLSTPQRYLVQQGLQYWRSQRYDIVSQLMAATTISIIPILTVFVVAQKNLIEGMVLTGLKG
jgi:multiple sugar transport system permease protein